MKSVLKVSKPNKHDKELAYQESLREKHAVLRGGEVAKEWEKFRDIVKGCTNDVCGMRCVGWQRRSWCGGSRKAKSF